MVNYTEMSTNYSINESSTVSGLEFTSFIDNSIFCPGYTNNTPTGHCRVIFDEILCWPVTPADSTAEQPCPNSLDDEMKAYRHCPANASWDFLKSDYSVCLTLQPTDPKDIQMAEVTRDIYFILSILSLVLLLITVFIFQYFKSLQCSRISIHKNLVVSFIFRFIFNIIITEPLISNRKSYRDIDWLCKVVVALSQYTALANVFWMFVEGFFLHHSLVLGVFSTKTPFKLFYAIGWGLPVVFTSAWAIVLHFEYHTRCWDDYSQLNYFYIIVVPFVLALVINLVFLVNIIRVLVSKLRANNRIESANIRKAIKATVVLMPLLGLTNLLFIMAPDDKLKWAYHLTNAVLHSSQGIFVAILYCFLNGEVRRVIKQKWYRFKISHGCHSSGRRRSSRTSSFFLTSGTEDDTDKSHPQNAAAEQLRMLQANMALKNEEPDTKTRLHEDTNHVNNNGSNGDVTLTHWKKNNNNGDVRFHLEPDLTIESTLERETVI